MITGIHHVSLRCETEEDKTRVHSFYGDVLGLPLKREWAGGAMFDTGAGLIEVFYNRPRVEEAGSVQHFALATDDVDDIIARVKAAGYEVTVEPRDGEIPSDPVFPIRMAFCVGPLGEVIEIFHER